MIVLTVRCFKWGLMCHPSRNMEDSGPEWVIWTMEVWLKRFQGRRILILPRDFSCDILVKNVDALCPCLKNLPEVKVKSFRLIALAKELSQQPSTDCLVIHSWVFLIKCSKLRKDKYKTVCSKMKDTWRRMELNPVFKEINRLKILNEIKWLVTTGQDPTQLSLHLVKWMFPEEHYHPF